MVQVDRAKKCHQYRSHNFITFFQNGNLDANATYFIEILACTAETLQMVLLTSSVISSDPSF